MSDKVKLNLGCGTGKIPGFINIDVDENLNPDKVYNIINEMPFQDSTADHIVMYHTIEHIQRIFWQGIFLDASRILEVGGKFWLSFPEASKCFDNWKTNYRGLKDFWEATILGRGASTWDRHIALCDSKDMCYLLKQCGFEIEYCGSEGGSEPYNTLIRCVNHKPLMYEQVLKESVWPTGLQSEQE